MATMVLFGVALVLTGCTSGSPSIGAPAAREASGVSIPKAPELAPPPLVAAAPEQATPDTGLPAAAMEDPVVAPGPETLDPAPAAAEPAAGATVAFSRAAPVIATEAPAPAPVAAEHTEQPAAPIAQAQATRLPPPAAPADGTILHYYRGPSGRPEVALTFDAGADQGYATEILDELQAHGIPATFGMTGQWAEANPDLIQRMAAEGHQIINHSWSHPSLTGASTGLSPITKEQLFEELLATENLVRELTGYEMKPYFRPPYGDIGPLTSGYLAEAGYYVDVLWSCDSFGWNGASAQQIIERCTTAEQGGAGAIILMHLGSDARGDLEALPGLIDYYHSNGYVFVTVEQMLQP